MQLPWQISLRYCSIWSPSEEKDLTIYARYDGLVSPSELDHSVTAGLRFSW